MIYEEDYFTQFLGENVPGINFKTWEATTERFNLEIAHCEETQRTWPYTVEISENTDSDEEGNIFVDAIAYPTLEEAKAFIDGWIAFFEAKEEI